LHLELLMGRQQIDLMGSTVATPASSARKLADGMRNGRCAALQRVKVIAAPGVAGEIYRSWLTRAST
jgi:hypothetical protein